VLRRLLILGLIILGGCFSNLDEDGGHYDQRTNRYVYVRPKKVPPSGYSQKVTQPRPGKPQMIYGRAAKIDEDLKSIWVQIEDRPTYQMIAESLSKGNREDKERLLRLHLRYVSPLGSIVEPGLKRQWQDYTTQTFERQFMNRRVYLEIHYQPESRQLEGYLFQQVKQNGETEFFNLNRWMIEQGLSVFFEAGASSDEIKEYRTAQTLAKTQKAGLWNYQ